MKNSTVRKVTAALVLGTALVGMASNAHAMKHSSTLIGVVGISSPVNYTVNNGVGTLTGDVDSHVEAALAVAALQKVQGVDRFRTRLYCRVRYNIYYAAEAL